MDAWAYIGGSVRGVKTGKYPGKNIFPAEGGEIRTKVLSVWPDVINKQTDSHAGEQEKTQSGKVPLIGKKEVQQRDSNKPKPQKIGYYEPFAKRNVVV